MPDLEAAHLMRSSSMDKGTSQERHSVDQEYRRTSQASAIDLTAQRIRDRILLGVYAPGQRLVEVDLLRDLSVGRSSLREALQRLVSEGLITITKNRGAAVSRLSRKEVRGLFEIREVLEGLAARRVAADIADPRKKSKILELRALNRGESSSPEGDLSYGDNNVRFHSTIKDLSDEPSLARFIDQLHILLFFLQFRHRLTRQDHELSRKEHKAVIDAILAGDPKLAEHAMREHVRNRAKRVDRLPDTDFKME